MQTAIHFRDVHPDKSRIAAISAAIAFNGMLLMFLVAPMTAPPVAELGKKEPDVILIPPPQAKKEEPIRVPIERQRPRDRAPVREQPRPAPITPPVLVDSQPGDEQAEIVPEHIGPVVPPADPVLPPDDGRPMEGAHLEYASAPPPAFPREAIRDQLTGTVVLEVLVDVDGTPLDVKVSRSSGHRVLDAAARKQVLSKWKFRPAMRNGRAVQAIGMVPVEFRLDE
ncbi:energy transducer TonB [Lysobacter humi (ex Lee et al. 2017)]